MKINHYILVRFILGIAVFFNGNSGITGYAQQKKSDARIIVSDVRQIKDSIHTLLHIEMNGIMVKSRQQLRFFPILKRDTVEVSLIPILINGNIQQQVLLRKEKLSGKKEPAYASFKVSKEGLNDTVIYESRIPVKPWMKNAQIAMVQELGNCRGEFNRTSVEIITPGIRFIEKPVQNFIYSPGIKFIPPPSEAIKMRAESGEALIVYSVGSAEIKPSMGNNKNELDKIQASINFIKEEPTAVIKAIEIASFASPEGRWESNLTLSERRAGSLSQWIKSNNRLPGIQIEATGYGEDWERLLELIQNDLVMKTEEKNEVLSIIRKTTQFDARESNLKNYNKGESFNYMLKYIFPLLRRSEYRIEYTVPEFTLEKSREIYKTRPQMLSLKEFYALANEHEPGSPEFVDILVVAGTLFPDEKIARLNMAAANLLSGNLAGVHHVLDNMEHIPEAWIYLGILYAKEKKFDQAEAFFLRARNAENKEAEKNLKELSTYREELLIYEKQLDMWERYGIK